MIVAGIGCRKGSSVAAIMSTINEALAAHGLTLGMLGKLATGEIKRDEPAIRAIARELKLPLDIVGNDALRTASGRCLSHSAKSIDLTGAASLSEAAALASAGKTAQLLGPRTVLDGVTCALARSEGGS